MTFGLCFHFQFDIRCNMIIYAFTAVGALYLVKLFFTPEPEPIAGVYKVPGARYNVKYCFFRLILWLRQRKNKKLESTSGQNAGYGVRSRSSTEDMDKVQDLPNVNDHPKAVDAVYFNAGNQDGYFFVAATARRQNNRVQTLLYLRTPDLGILQGNFMSESTNLEGSDPKSFAAGGLKLIPLKAMKEWQIQFSGEMVSHQTHYEQFGDITGTVKIEGHADVKLNISGVRDHSYGNKRDWRDLYRYAIQYCTLEDRTAICLGVISMPRSLSRLLMGYVFHPDGKLDSVSWSSFELYEYGEDGNPPKEFNAKFTAGGKMYSMKCTVVDYARFFIGDGKDARIFERFCDYEVNGQKGWGISEWDYRNSKKFFDDGEDI
eukprot:XP_019927338.1 PREDICTED: uncharacterized protein LOC105339207 isoform X2 [Crassostrea gigas]